jgi:thiamine transporter ThiT
MTKIEQMFPVFGAVFAVIYAVVLDYNWALFTYHPRLGEWDWGAAAPKAGGPAMYWYGVVGTTALAALVVTAVVSLIPENTRARVAWPNLTWILPLCSMVFLAWLLSPYYTK